MLSHQQKINRVADRVLYLSSAGTKIRVYHGSTNTTRTLRRRRDEIVDVSDLNRVLEVNTKKRSVIIEPNVPMDKLVSTTIKYGLVPPVVPEFPGITVGGAVAGGSAESASIQYGLFHNLALSYEIVLGTGEVIKASSKTHPDLFYGTGGTCGTLGIITAIELNLVPATKYVRLEYIVVKDRGDLLKKVTANSGSKADFVDAILFENGGVVVLGFRTDNRDGIPVRRFSRPWSEWFYLHAKKMAESGGGSEVVPLQVYLFRYDRGAFWMGDYAFQTYPYHIPNNRFTRFLFNPLLKTRMLYRGLQESNIAQQYIIQDCCVPGERAAEFLDYIDSSFQIYPLWVLPIAPEAFSDTNIRTKSFVINVGIWGPLGLPYEKFVEKNIELEKAVAQLGGCKAPYGHFYGDKNIFWKNLKKETYEKLRKKYHADRAFPPFYDKIRVNERYTPTVTKGFFRALRPFWRLPLS